MKTFCLLSFLLCCHNVYSQSGQIDTILLARDLATSQKFEEANILLAIYNSNNTNTQALLQQAQLLYWMKKSTEAKLIYERTLIAFPDDVAVKQDYGKFLFEHNKFAQARVLLRTATAKNSQDFESLRMLTYIDLWSGRIGEARSGAELLEQLQPGNNYSADILTTIKNYTTPVLTMNGGGYSDDQPLKRYTFDVEGTVYRSWIFAPYVGATLHQFNVGEAKFRTSWLRAGNKIYIAPTNTHIELSAGSFRARENNAGTTYKLKLTQKISSSLSFDGTYEKKPYQYTISSIRLPFLYTLSDLGLNYNRKNRWLGRAAYQHQGFGDTNSVSTVYAWLLVPVLHKNKWSIKAGYGFSNSDAKENNFRPKQSDVNTLGSSIEGIYDPYFTPFDQSTHSVLGSINYNPTKKVTLSSNFSVGIYSTAFQPYHFLEGNNLGQLIINKQYVAYKFTPIEFSAGIKTVITKNLVADVSYQYNSLLFFKSHFVNLQLKYLFLHAARKK